MLAIPLLLAVTFPAANTQSSVKDVRATIEKGLPFLEKSSAAWRTDRKCVTCHQVPFTLWALNDAKARGFKVDAAKLDDLTKWAFNFCATNENDGKKNGGFHLTSVDMILSRSSAAPREDVLKVVPLFETLFAKRQKPDGSWSEGNHVKIAGAEREADEVDTMWTLLALKSLDQLGDKIPADTRKGLTAERDKALAFLKEAKPGKRIDWLALRMLIAKEYETPERATELQKELQKLQNTDGGWGYVRGGASYPHTTGECLYALGVMGQTGDRCLRASRLGIPGRQPAAGRFVEGAEPASIQHQAGQDHADLDSLGNGLGDNWLDEDVAEVAWPKWPDRCVHLRSREIEWSPQLGGIDEQDHSRRCGRLSIRVARSRGAGSGRQAAQVGVLRVASATDPGPAGSAGGGGRATRSAGHD